MGGRAGWLLLVGALACSEPRSVPGGSGGVTPAGTGGVAPGTGGSAPGTGGSAPGTGGRALLADAGLDAPAPPDLAAPADRPAEQPPADLAAPPRDPLGAACTAGATCQSNLCVDGVCCDRACDGVCEACSQSGTCAGVIDELDGATCTGADRICAGAGTCGQLDQRQPMAVPAGPNAAPQDNPSFRHEIAQTLRVGKTGRLVAIRAQFWCNAQRTMRLEVQTTRALMGRQVPSGTVLASEVVRGADYVANQRLMLMVVFAQPATVTAGTRLALVWKATDQLTDTPCLIYFNEREPYPEGEAVHLIPSWNPDWIPSNPPADLSFETIIAP